MSNLVKVKDVIERVNTKEDRFNTDRLYYVGGEHFQSRALTVDDRGIIKGSTIGPMFYYGFKSNDFLLVSRNPHLRKAGLVNFDGICSEKTFVLHTKDERILLQKFMPFIFQNERFWKYAIANKHGSTNFFVNWSTLADYSFELPSIEQQKAISKLLWALNDTKKAYEDLIQKTDELVKSQFIEMFGDAENRASLESLCTVFADGDWIESKDQANEGIRLIQTGNIGNAEYINKDERARFISDETFDRLSCTEVFPGDVLISRLPDPIARCCIVPNIGQRAITAVDCTIVRFKKEILPDYFKEYTLIPDYSHQVQNFVTGSTRQRISRKNLGAITVPVPELEEQKTFVELAQQSDKSKFELNEAIKDLDAMYKRIIKDNLG